MNNKPSSPPEWISRRSRLYWYDQYALNEQASAFANYDPDRIVAEVSATGADIVALYATNQFSIAYYPSQIWPAHPGLKGRDYFGDLLTRFQARGIKVIAYINWLDSKHADWTMVPLNKNESAVTAEQPLVSWAKPDAPNGRVQALAGGAWQAPCPLSPQREQVAAITREICERYRPDALHLDMLHSLSPCACKRCRAELASTLGIAGITAAALNAHWDPYIDWWRGKLAGIIDDLGAILREHGVVAAHNFGLPLWPAANGMSEDWLKSLDVIVSEAFDAFGVLDLNATSINLLLQHALDKPAWLLRTSSPMKMAHWPIPATHWLLHSAACKANGAAAFGPCGVTAYPDTRTPAAALAGIKTAFDDYMLDADLARGASQAGRVALLFSLDTRRHVPENPANAWIDNEFYGWARLLIEEHIPFRVLTDQAIASGKADLSECDVLILPDAACMSDNAIAAVRAAVGRGLGLVATGRTSLRTGRGAERIDFGLGDVLGVERLGEERGPFAIEASPDPEPGVGRLQHVRSRGKVLRRAFATDPAGSVTSADDPMPTTVTENAVLSIHTHGSGRTAYIAFDAGCYFNDRSLAATGRLMLGALDAVLPQRQVQVRAPRTVEITLWKQEAMGRTIIHVANRTVPWSLPTAARQITEIIPVHGIEISIPCPDPSVRVGFRQTTGTIQTFPGHITVRLGEVGTYAAVVLDSKST